MAQEIPDAYEQLDLMLKASVEESINQGKPVFLESVGEQEVEIIKVIHNQPELTVCDYRNIIIDPTCGGEFEKANS